MLNPDALEVFENWHQMSREEKKATSGCVIRSLQSAMKVKATEEDWDKRFAQIGKLRLTGIWRHLGVKARKELMDEDYHSDLANLVELVSMLKVSQTPLGLALSLYDVEMMKRDIGGIFALLAQSKKILLATPHHLSHIAKVPQLPYLVSLSDQGYPMVTLEPRSLVRDIMVFTPL